MATAGPTKRQTTREARSDFEQLAAAKAALLADHTPIAEDSSTCFGPYDKSTDTIGSIARQSQPYHVQQVFYTLTLMLRPARILDLGTAVGMSSAYLAAAQACAGVDGTVTTLDASPVRLKIAQRLHASVGLENVRYASGMAEQDLQRELALNDRFDMAVVDAAHGRKGFLTIYEYLIEAANPGALIIFVPDARHTGEIAKAWDKIKADERSGCATQLGDLKLVYCYDAFGRT